MRIIIATINRPEGDTGVHTHTRALSGGLRAAGASVEVISAFDGGPGWLGLFAVRPVILNRLNRTWGTLWHRRWHGAALRRALVRDFGRRLPDRVIAQCPVSAAAAIEARRDMRGSFPIAMVCHFNVSEADEYRARGDLKGDRVYRQMLAFEDRILREVDRVIYVSHWARKSVEQSRNITPRASSVIWNGIEDRAENSILLSRSGLGLHDGDLVLVNVGTLEPRKNQLKLLDLFAAIVGNHPAARLLLIGDGPDRPRIKSRIAELSLSDKVMMLGHRRDVASILPLADLCLHAAALENCPLVLIECARAGLPFAAFAAGGVPELQRALDCRFEIDPEDLSASMEALAPLLNDVQMRKETGARARENFRRSFSLSAMTRAYLDAMEAA
jgi:glycosyltransferase involved in cell wall biosynthesis